MQPVQWWQRQRQLLTVSSGHGSGSYPQFDAYFTENNLFLIGQRDLNATFTEGKHSKQLRRSDFQQWQKEISSFVSRLTGRAHAFRTLTCLPCAPWCEGKTAEKSREKKLPCLQSCRLLSQRSRGTCSDRGGRTTSSAHRCPLMKVVYPHFSHQITQQRRKCEWNAPHIQSRQKVSHNKCPLIIAKLR